MTHFIVIFNRGQRAEPEVLHFEDGDEAMTRLGG
jgi:hypothetical protein